MNKIGEKVNLPDAAFFPSVPPNHVFEEKGFVKDPHVSVAQNYVTYIYDYERPGGAVEYRDGEGIFTYYKGVELPRNGLPFSQAVYAVNSVKRIIVHSVKIVNLLIKELNFRLIGLVFVSKKKRARILEQALISLELIAKVTLAQYYMKPGYYTKTAKEVWKFTRAFLLSLGISYQTADKTGEIFAMLFEFDDAYRFPLQDLMSETTKEKLLNEFPKEIGRLLRIEAERENTGRDENNITRYYKFAQFTRLLKIMWWIPSVRKAIKAGLSEVTHENWQLDKADVFYTYLWSDYNVRGKTMEERIKEYYEIFNNDESKMPPRIQLRIK